MYLFIAGSLIFPSSFLEWEWIPEVLDTSFILYLG